MAAIEHDVHLHLFRERDHAFDLNRPLGRQHHTLARQHAFERPVVSGPRQSLRILFVNRLRQLVMLGIEIDLAHIGDRTHERSRISAATAAEAAVRKRNHLPDRGHDHHVARAVARQTDDATLPRKDIARWERYRGCVAAVACRLDVAVRGENLIRRFVVRDVRRPVFRSARGGRGNRHRRCCNRRRYDRGLRSSATTPARGSHRRSRGVGQAPVTQRVHEAGINRQPFALDHPRIGRRGDVFAYRFDESVANHDRTVFDDGAGNADNARVAQYIG